MKRVVTIFAILFVSIKVVGQTASSNMLYEKFWSAGLSITNSGFNFNCTKGQITNAHTRKFFEIEFATIHHPKEYKQTQDFGFSQVGVPNPKAFVYGKQNSFYNLNISYGIYKELGRKADRTGVAIGIKALGGVSLGILKPYYLDLLYPIDNFTANLVSEKYSDENKDKFLDINSIYGGSGYNYGLTQLKLIPGLHTKLGFHFDYAIYDEYLKSIEAGVFFSGYFKNVPVMIIKKNQQFYPGIYVGFEFGKKS